MKRLSWWNHLMLVLLGATYAVSRNPIVSNMGLADPHVHVKKHLHRPQSTSQVEFLLFGTHDYSSDNTYYKMKDWWVWNSSDLVTWEVKSVLDPSVFHWETMATKDECWATDAAQTSDNQWYWYLSVGPDSIGVVTGFESEETGEMVWNDPLGKALLSSQYGQSLNPPTEFRDPSIFQEDDGVFYLIAGVFEYYIFRLNPDMISFDGEPYHIRIDPNGASAWGPYGNATDDKPFLHKRDNLYYLSWGCFYATSSSLFGPYIYQGYFIHRKDLAENFRMPLNGSLPWYSQEDFADRHGSFFHFQKQWYFITNDRSHSTDVENPEYFRDSVIGYVHFRPDGSIAPVGIDSIGVGSHLADRGIEIEEYFALYGHGYKITLVGDLERDVDRLYSDADELDLSREKVGLAGLSNGSTLIFTQVDFSSLDLYGDSYVFKMIIHILPTRLSDDAPNGELHIRGGDNFDGRCDIPLVRLHIDDERYGMEKNTTFFDHSRKHLNDDQNDIEIHCSIFKKKWEEEDYSARPRLNGVVFDLTTNFIIPDEKLSAVYGFPVIDKISFISESK